MALVGVSTFADICYYVVLLFFGGHGGCDSCKSVDFPLAVGDVAGVLVVDEWR